MVEIPILPSLCDIISTHKLEGVGYMATVADILSLIKALSPMEQSQ
ncbi:hypothetical protein SBF1_1590006 [Candidatus Desulfosporosinus infrequens]|uniref:Uncharacterized protein n=1 Tax=Candidatus Desulfosporosinus infrequens TaxID=2043169 RepID=A0A2U3K928_9FIRM|nr:hypothetical protein SBF1_1590006 [Candidatus Desulfosporosinus infrequens]